MIEFATAAAWGFAAGLGVAMPLGAIGVLVVRVGWLDGFRAGATAGLGVAAVDLGYCAVAFAAGGWLAGLVQRWAAGALIVSGAVLIGIGAWQAWGARRPGTAPAGATPRRHLFARFVALTALNPVTVTYFAALAAALAARDADLSERVAFVAGAGVASAAWQLTLAALGAALGRAVGPRVGAILNWVGAGIVAALGIAAAASGIVALA